MSSRTLASFGVAGAVIACAVLSPGAQTPAASLSQSAIDFAADIRPILDEKCLSCHGDALKLSRLDLRTRDSAIERRRARAGAGAGQRRRSRLYRHVAGLEQPAMPMRGTPLTAATDRHDQAMDRRGRHVARHGHGDARGLNALRRCGVRGPPRSRRKSGATGRSSCPCRLLFRSSTGSDFTNPIDRFLEQARAKRGLRPAPRADRLTLVRRAYLDLLGLPPSPAEVARFIADDTPGAWERLIDTLLASPHYGERYGRHWLDVARYADSAGFEYDVHRPNAWRYRDYVIQPSTTTSPTTHS